MQECRLRRQELMITWEVTPRFLPRDLSHSPSVLDRSSFPSRTDKTIRQSRFSPLMTLNRSIIYLKQHKSIVDDGIRVYTMKRSLPFTTWSAHRAALGANAVFLMTKCICMFCPYLVDLVDSVPSTASLTLISRNNLGMRFINRVIPLLQLSSSRSRVIGRVHNTA